MSFLQSLHKVSERSVIHPRLEWQPWSCTDVGFPHPFPIKSAILAGKFKWFSFSFLFELITSGSKAAGFAVNPRLTKLLFFLPIWWREGGREGANSGKRTTVSFSKLNASYFCLPLVSSLCFEMVAFNNFDTFYTCL